MRKKLCGGILHMVLPVLHRVSRIRSRRYYCVNAKIDDLQLYSVTAIALLHIVCTNSFRLLIFLLRQHRISHAFMPSTT